MELIYLISYAAIMCGISIHAFKKKYNVVYSMLWTAYAVSGVFCVLCKVFQEVLVGKGIMHDIWYDLSDTTLWGYLLIILCCTIAFRPFKLFDRNSHLNSFGQSKKSKQFFKIYSYIYIFCALVFIVLSIKIIIGIFSISDLGVLRQDLYGNSENESGFIMTNNFIANLCYKVCLKFKYLSVYISFAMIKEKTNRRLGIILLLTSTFLYFLYTFANAARGGLLIYVFCTFLIGICFFNYMSKANRRRIIIYASVILAVVLLFFITVTIARFGQDGGGGNPILRNICFYLGHGPIEFSKVTGSLRDFAYGKVIIGRLMNYYFGVPFSWEAIQAEIGYPPLGPVFTTYLGYLYTDFGAVGCLLFVTSWSYFMSKLVRTRPNRISTIFLFLYYLSYYVTGIFGIGRLEYAAFISTHVMYLLIRFMEDYIKSKSRSGYEYKYKYVSGYNVISNGKVTPIKENDGKFSE